MAWWTKKYPASNVHHIQGGGIGGLFKLLFWINQIILGLPCFYFGIDLVTRGRTDGIINVIGLFLAWIGGSLTWGMAALMHERFSFSLPAVYRVAIEQGTESTGNVMPVFDQTYKAFPYRKLQSGAIEVSTASGLRTFSSFDEFRQIVDRS